MLPRLSGNLESGTLSPAMQADKIVQERYERLGLTFVLGFWVEGCGQVGQNNLEPRDTLSRLLYFVRIHDTGVS